MQKYDIIVVGAGPAGSTFAGAAATDGLSVLLLDRKEKIGTPVRCGEAIADDELRKFHQPRTEWIDATVTKFGFIAPNGSKITVKLKNKGYILDRTKFDYDLAKIAEENGAKINQNTNVTGLLFDGEFVSGVQGTLDGKPFQASAKIVVGADGVESRIGRMAGMKTALKLSEIDTGYQKTISGVEMDQDICDFYVTKTLAPHGYLWVFPKGNGLANVGIGISGKDSMKGESVKIRLDRFLADKFPNHKVLNVTMGGIPISKPMEKMVSNGVMLVGDAVRAVNPLTGGGIILGMKSAALAAKVTSNVIKSELAPSSENLLDYQNKWMKNEGKQINRIFRIQKSVTKLTDEQMTRIIEKVKKLPAEKQTIARIFRSAIPQKPSLLLDIAKVFVGH